MAKLHDLTNLRVVPDETSDTGYRVEVGPFLAGRPYPRGSKR